MEWQPIESAPKDGSEFIAYWRGPLMTEGQRIIAKWADDMFGARFVGVNVKAPDGNGTVSHLEWGWPAKLCATHWMPLPTPPRASLNTP